MSNMSVASDNRWVRENLEDLVLRYGGKWIIVLDQEILFADNSFDLVLKYALNNLKGKNYVLKHIDSGEAILYGVKVSFESNPQ